MDGQTIATLITGFDNMSIHDFNKEQSAAYESIREQYWIEHAQPGPYNPEKGGKDDRTI